MSQLPIPDIIHNTAEHAWSRLSVQPSHQDIADKIKMMMGLSDFVTEKWLQYPEWIEDCITVPPEAHRYETELRQKLANVSDEIGLHRILRQFRHKEMLRITCADFIGNQSIEESLAQVSELAHVLIIQAYQWLYAKLCQRYAIPQGQYGEQPLIIIGMGKLGGKELNFSSDIDLIFCYPESGEMQTKRKTLEHHQFFTKLAQQLIAALHNSTVDGQVFRVDMRLRPFGESGPLVCQFASLEDYYQEQGREWERYAMIKGRVLNAESPYLQELTNIIRPFVYRRYIDFGVLESLRSMKHLIQQEVRRRNLGNNIKLGSGGIREIEFIVQCFQLTRGGRELELQQRHLLDVLAALNRMDIISTQTATELKAAYLYLRKVEQCLQQLGDQQTQELVSGELDQARMAWLLGEKSYDIVVEKINQHRETVSQHFANIVGEAEPEPADSIGSKLSDIWQLSLNSEEVEALLQELLPSEDVASIAQQILSFKQDIEKRPLATRGKTSLDKLMPIALQQCLEHETKDHLRLLSRLLTILRAILRRTAYLDLLLENGTALVQLLNLCDRSPWITDQLAHFPLLLDELINPSALFQPTPLEDYAGMLRQTLLRVPQEDLELQMESLRQFKLSQQLRVAAEDITGHLPLMKVSDHLTVLAETLVQEVLNIAWSQMVEKYGYPEGADEDNRQFAVIGYGKLGGIELGYSSDLDLVFLHGAKHSSVTAGPKSIESPLFYMKLAQRILHFFNTKTASGELYEIDMRLRPSGNSGLLVSHIEAYLDYQNNEAWTWEHQALVRSRAIAGTPELCQRFDEIRQQVLTQSRDIESLKQDVSEMRKKMREHLDKSNASEFDLKNGFGGIGDIEFLVQFWTLAHAAQSPAIAKWSDNIRLLETLAQAEVISDDKRDRLTDAYIELRNATHRQALKYDGALVANDVLNEVKDVVKAEWTSQFGH